MSAPDLTKKVIGFRRWSPTDDGALSSQAMSAVWGRGANKARCQSNPYTLYWTFGSSSHTPPKPRCKVAPGPCGDCGLYALHECPSEIAQSQGPFASECAQIVGAVAAWGKVDVHRDGFRAEYAEVVALGYCELWPASWVERVERSARAYDVPHLPGKELEQYALMLGERVPESLYPPKEQPKPAARGWQSGGLISAGSYHDLSLSWEPLKFSLSRDEAATEPEKEKKKWWQR